MWRGLHPPLLNSLFAYMAVQYGDLLYKYVYTIGYTRCICVAWPRPYCFSYSTDTHEQNTHAKSHLHRFWVVRYTRQCPFPFFGYNIRIGASARVLAWPMLAPQGAVTPLPTTHVPFAYYIRRIRSYSCRYINFFVKKREILEEGSNSKFGRRIYLGLHTQINIDRQTYK